MLYYFSAFETRFPPCGGSRFRMDPAAPVQPGVDSASGSDAQVRGAAGGVSHKA
jgi:hypothetical protein